jgi:hypothetical protein
LFIVLSLSALCLFLMGSAVAPFTRVPGRLFEQTALAIGLGILIDYCLMLTGQPIARVLAGALLVAFSGAFRFWRGMRVHSVRRMLESRTAVVSIVVVIYILAVYYIRVLSEPLVRWDARSIWFFHARMIWIEGALRETAGWTHPSIVFSHPDYPLLVPAIAAQLGYLKGYWNEFLPKGSLVLMLVPIALWTFSFRKITLSFVLLVLSIFAGLGAWHWNGFMDGYLAIYSAVALLTFGRYLSQGTTVDLCSSMVAIGIAASLKNEGLLFAVCFIAAVLALGVKYSECSVRRLATRLRSDYLVVGVLLLSIAPTLMWAVCKKAWGIQSELVGDPFQTFTRLAVRLFDGTTAQYLLGYLTVRATAASLLTGVVAALVVFQWRRRLKLHPGAAVAALTATLYICGLYAIYLSTPYNLQFHLTTSGTRTMTTGTIALIVGVFFLLSDLEAGEGPVEQPALERQSTP